MHSRTLIAVLAFLIVGAVHAEKPDLKGAEYVWGGICTFKEEIAPCAVYEKQGTQYAVFRNNSNQMSVRIFRVRDGAKAPYQEKDFTLLWAIEEEWPVVT